MSLFDGLFTTGIAVATGDPRANWQLAWPEEEFALSRALPVRQGEFRAGRALARQAMVQLGLAPAAIPAAPDRSPIWPTGTVGSISHCPSLCAAAIGRSSDGILAIGIDLEPAEPLAPDLIAEICTADEQAWLLSLPKAHRGLYARLIFSAKECTYKCQFPLSQALFDFSAITIEIDPAGSFIARFNIDASPFRTRMHLTGNFAMDTSHIATAMTLTRQHMALLPSSETVTSYAQSAHG